jgi:3-methyladenine DNA glycosylase AlkD
MAELGPSSTAREIVEALSARRDEANIEGMNRFGIVTDTALGISNADLRIVARQIRRNHPRALELWQSRIREARLLASYTAEPKKLTLDEARQWARDFNSWEIVDGVSDLFVEAGHAPILIPEFSSDEREFIRRTAFTMMCWVAVHLKKEPDETVLAYLPLIEKYASDPRNFVKKAVNWALRSIGKRNANCRKPAWHLAIKLAASDDKTARWIGNDAIREFEKKFGPSKI